MYCVCVYTYSSFNFVLVWYKAHKIKESFNQTISLYDDIDYPDVLGKIINMVVITHFMIHLLVILLDNDWQKYYTRNYAESSISEKGNVLKFDKEKV